MRLLKQNSTVVNSKIDLDEFLQSKEIKENVQESKSILAQVFITIESKEDIDFTKSLIKTIESKIPRAIVVGASSCGGICDGEIINRGAIISLTFFSDTYLKSFGLPCQNGEEEKVGKYLGKKIMSSYSNVLGILVFATTLTIKPDKFIESLCENINDVHIFGGAGGIYLGSEKSIVFNEKDIFDTGVVVVVFASENLQIEKHSYIGWEPLSREMTVTNVENSIFIKEIEGETPFSIYEKYLGIKKNDVNFMNAVEFPLLLKRNGETLARVFGRYFEDGTAFTTGDIKEGEKVRIGYGDPEIIIKNAKNIHEKIKKFNPEVIFIYSCYSRQLLMQEDDKLEIEPFQWVAPTVGAYTYGELCSISQNTSWKNATLVAVGMREGPPKYDMSYSEVEIEEKSNSLQSTLLLKLVHFIRAVVEDFEIVQQELELLSNTDKLTGLNNRGRIDEILKDEIEQVKNNEYNISIILLDIDYFKLVNDTYGHHVGDIVLVEIANILKTNIRKCDIVGRWGGEEFMIILKNINLENAVKEAERIRKVICNYKFTTVGNISASFGVTNINKFDDEVKVLNRVDNALYKAKNTGRNKVVSFGCEEN